MSDSKDDIFFPDIDQYLENTENKKSVSIQGLEELVFKLQAATGLTQEASNAIIKLFFQEIRNAILRGEIVFLSGFGKIFMSSPKNSKNKNRVFPKFKPYKNLIRKLNDK